MTLYHVALGNNSGECQFHPRVPAHRLSGEDSTTKRICFSDSIERALAACPDTEYARNCWITVYTANIDENDPNLIGWHDVWTKHNVLDACVTHEHWYLKELTLVGVCYKTNDFLVNDQLVCCGDGKALIVANLIDYLRHRQVFGQADIDAVLKEIEPLDEADTDAFIAQEFPDVPIDELYANSEGFAHVVSWLQLTPACPEPQTV